MSEAESKEKIVVSFENVTVLLEFTPDQYKAYFPGKKMPVVRGARADSLQAKIREEIKKFIADKRAGLVITGARMNYMTFEKKFTDDENSNGSACSAALKALVVDGYLKKISRTGYEITGKQ